MKHGAALHAVIDDPERIPVRQSLDAKAQVWFSDNEVAHSIVVRNISCGGMMAVCDLPLAIGESVRAEIEAYGEITGRVVWAVSPRIGISFDTPLNL